LTEIITQRKIPINNNTTQNIVLKKCLIIKIPHAYIDSFCSKKVKRQKEILQEKSHTMDAIKHSSKPTNNYARIKQIDFLLRNIAKIGLPRKAKNNKAAK
jgi:hypothetical protein